MSEQTPDPAAAGAEPTGWDFNAPAPGADAGHMATKDDIRRIEGMIAQIAQGQPQRTAVDPSRLTTDADREIAAILEKLEKDPVNGFKDHTQFMVSGVTKAVSAEVSKNIAEMMRQQQMEMQLPAFREAIVKRVGVGLNEGGVNYLREYLGGYDMVGLAKIGQDTPTLNALRNAAENVHRKGGAAQPAAGSGGTSAPAGGTQPGAGLTNDQETDAQEMFNMMKGVKGYTIEMARAAVGGVDSDPALFTQASPDWRVK